MERRLLTNMNRDCPFCGGLVPYWGDTCVSCKQQVIPSNKLRKYAVFYVVIGLALTGGMGYLMVSIAHIIRHSGDPGASVRFNGSPLAIVLIYAILAVPLGVGITSIATGISQMHSGRRNLKLVRISMFWLWLFVGLAVLTQVIDGFGLLPKR